MQDIFFVFPIALIIFMSYTVFNEQQHKWEKTMTAQHATKITPAMVSTDRDIAALVHFARGASEGDHPIYGNFIADVLDALVEVHGIYGERTAEESNAAEELVDTATRLRDHVDALLMGDV